MFQVLLLLALAGLTLSAQEFRGTINGRITDATGAAVPDVKVTITNVATGEQSQAVSTNVGGYTVPFLRPGRYNVSAESAGFKRVLREDIEVRVGDAVTVDLEMQVGDVAESVTVTDEAPLLQESTASRGEVLDNLRVTQLPLNGRNPINFTNLTPGVIFAGNPQFTRPFDNGDNVNFSINGGLRQTNSYLLDGTPDEAVTDTAGDRTRGNVNVAYIPTVDAVQEFRVVTNFYDAQYGRTGGGIINITTKSGTNDLHGTAYWFGRRYQWDANTISNNAAVSAAFPQGRPRYGVDPVTGENLGGNKLDQYGTHITGPVWIPGLYNGQNRTFFSFGVEDYNGSTPNPQLNSVPSLAMRQGDFSALGINIYDPTSTRDNPNFNSSQPESVNNPRYIRTPFPGNRIPEQYWNQVGRAILNAYPAPNVGDPNAFTNNFIASPNIARDDFRNWIGRVDQNFTDSWRTFFRYAYNRRDEFNSANGFEGPGMDAQDPLVRENNNAVVDNVIILSPNTILNLRGGYTRFIQAAYRTSVTGIDITQFGFPAGFANGRFTDQPPRIEVQGYPNWGARNPSQNTTNLLSFIPSVSLVRGRHSMKIGGDIRDIRANAFGGSFLWGSGQFAFNRDFTQQVPGFNNGTGHALASLLLGFPSGGTVQNVPRLAYRWGYYAVYFNDDIRVSDRLTVNLGLRYDVEGVPTERYNRQNRGFGFEQASPLASAVAGYDSTICPSCANLRGGLLFADEDNRAPFEHDLNNWQPRVGAAYRLGDRTVLRGGYGLFYLPEASYGGAAGFASDTPFQSTQGGGINQFIPFRSLSDPYPQGFIAPTGSSLGLNTFLGRDIIFGNLDRKIGKVHSYSFGIQHQLPWDIVVDASYVGSRTRDINTNMNQAGGARNLNVPTIQQLQQAQQNPAFFTGSVANPFQGLLPGTNLNNATITRRQLLLPYPQFGAVRLTNEPVGKLWYDSLQMQFQKRYSAGLTMNANYTWSKNIEALAFMNDQDPEPSKVIAAQDRTHRFVVSSVYQLPFGRGRAFGGDMPRALDWIAGGWEYNVLGIVQSGTPMNLSGDYDVIGDPRLDDQGYNQWFNGCVRLLDGTTRRPNANHRGFETGCSDPVFQQRNTNFTLRTSSLRTSRIRNPWAPQFDMSINKRFGFTERINAEFRVEAFNVFNTPIRPEPNTDPGSDQFGFVSVNQRNFPRNVQLGVKFNF